MNLSNVYIYKHIIIHALTFMPWPYKYPYLPSVYIFEIQSVAHTSNQ